MRPLEGVPYLFPVDGHRSLVAKTQGETKIRHACHKRATGATRIQRGLQDSRGVSSVGAFRPSLAVADSWTSVGSCAWKPFATPSCAPSASKWPLGNRMSEIKTTESAMSAAETMKMAWESVQRHVLVHRTPSISPEADARPS
jgi:hypothetical protein